MPATSLRSAGASRASTAEHCGPETTQIPHVWVAKPGEATHLKQALTERTDIFGFIICWDNYLQEFALKVTLGASLAAAAEPRRHRSSLLPPPTHSTQIVTLNQCRNKPMSLKQNLQQRFKGQESGPLATSWPSIPSEDRTAVVDRLRQELGGIKLPSPRKRKRNDGTSDDVPKSTSAASLCLGINAVTRALEAHRGEDDTAWPVGAVVVANRGVRPPMLVQHLVVMAAVRRVPVVALGIDSVALGEILGLKRLLVLAVRKGEATTGGSLSEFLARHGTLPIVPWATGTASQQPIRAASAVKLRPRRRA